MSTLITPISAGTSASLLLHATAFALLLQWQVEPVAQGNGLQIELVSSESVANDIEVDKASTPGNPLPVVMQQDRVPETLSVVGNEHTRVENDIKQFEPVVHQVAESETINNDRAELTRATSASQQQQSIIELLHARINENKHYPYLARRQQREGIATVVFTLLPDGSIDTPLLVRSSKTRALDAAALSAVTSIEPFMPAKEHLEQAETFEVDVVFDIL